MDTFRGNLQLATVHDLDRLFRLVARLGLDVLNLGHDIHALHNLAEDDVLAIEPATGAQVSSPVRLFLWMEEARGGSYEVTTVVMKNWEPLVSLPALAMDNRPGLECFSLKFSSSKRSP